jgi:hypothetical protein
LTSVDGVNWIGRTSGTSERVFAALYGANRFVAAAVGGIILFSPDGTNWSMASSSTAQNLYAIAYGSGIYVVVGSNGAIAISADGNNWKPVDSARGREWRRGVCGGRGRGRDSGFVRRNELDFQPVGRQRDFAGRCLRKGQLCRRRRPGNDFGIDRDDTREARGGPSRC